MELIEIRKRSENLAQIHLKIANTEKKYSFKYSDSDIFVVDFPEELRKILRLLPVSMTHSLVDKIENYLKSDVVNFPFEMEIEKEILQSV